MAEQTIGELLPVLIQNLQELEIIDKSPELKHDILTFYQGSYRCEISKPELTEYVLGELSGATHDKGCQAWLTPSQRVFTFHPRIIYRPRLYSSILRRIADLVNDDMTIDGITELCKVSPESGKRSKSVSFRCDGYATEFNTRRPGFDPKLVPFINQILADHNKQKRLFLAKGENTDIGRCYILFYNTPEWAERCADTLGLHFNSL